MNIYSYILAASKNPDKVDCYVPYKVNSEIIFFGPCKKRLRKRFYKEYLKTAPPGEVELPEAIYLVGMNGSNDEKFRKIVWVGRVTTLLTFERAFLVLQPQKAFEPMIRCSNSPLHLEPIFKEKTFVGYKLRSKLHEKRNEWIADVIDEKDRRVEIKENEILLKDPETRKDVFIKDCCFLCENLFFAEGKGLEIGQEILTIFQTVQANRDGVDNYNIFGKKADGSAYGRPGYWLLIEGEPARNLIELIKMKAQDLTYHNKGANNNLLNPKNCQ